MQEDTNKMISVVTHESNIAAGEQEKANQEEELCTQLAGSAAIIQGEANKELEEALPAMMRAQEAVKCLNKASIGEMKGFAKPLPQIVDVSTVTLILLKSEKKNHQWQNAQKMMNNPMKFVEEIGAFKGEEIEDWKLNMV